MFICWLLDAELMCNEGVGIGNLAEDEFFDTGGLPVSRGLHIPALTPNPIPTSNLHLIGHNLQLASQVC